MGTGWRNARKEPKRCHLCVTIGPPTPPACGGPIPVHAFKIDGLLVDFRCPTTKDEYERDRETISRTVAEILDEQRRGT